MTAARPNARVSIEAAEQENGNGRLLTAEDAAELLAVPKTSGASDEIEVLFRL